MLTDKEKQIISDTEFLISKIEITKKIHNQLELTKYEIEEVIKKSNFDFDINIDTKVGKLFKGENYRSLPYLVLEYPKLYSKESVFTYRTMFLWGNFFSSTIHLEGALKTKYEMNILNNLNTLVYEQVFISVGKTPWEYHYEESNYNLLNKYSINRINEKQFLKLSKKFNLSDYDIIPKLSASFFSTLLSIFS